ncbi:MAG: matrixin family metalloprotease [Phycisphaerales bacterium]|nr:matrixin family metalloprotease [Phycisphaerales bacterium]
MAMNTRALLFTTTLTLSAGFATSALAGEHGQLFSTCGTDSVAQQRQLHGAGILKADALEFRLTDDQIQALNEHQIELLLNIEELAYEGMPAPHVCLHPDTDPKIADAFEQFLQDLWFETRPNAFILSGRWSVTATNGAGLQQGDATTLTYSFVPDGTNIIGEGSSNLQSTMNSIIGNGTWQSLFDQALNAWSDVSGLNYVNEPNDDGVSISGFGSGAAGQLGIRGDVRISGNFIDGGGNVLAYNYFPNNGDMVIDTGDSGFYSNGSNNYRRLRNVVTHEAGHGIGLAHVESDSDRFLMEPFIDTSFDGPQIDDIRGAQRGYGDIDENNNSFGSATDFASATFRGGGFVGGQTKSITLRSMDDNSDVDYYSLTTAEPVTLSLFLSPTGGQYQNTAQGGGGGGAFFDAESVSDLNIKVADITTSILADVDAEPAGEDEALVVELPDPGQYFIIVDNDNTNNIQTYSLLAFFTTLEVETCDPDFNEDGELDFFDISAFLTAYGNQEAQADYNNDGEFDFFDISSFLTDYGAGCP